MLAPSASVTLGNLRYDTHAAELTVRRGVLPILDRVDFRLPRGVRLEAAAGDDLLVDMDAGEGVSTVFTGTVSSVTYDLTGARVTGHNGGAALARFRPSASLEKLSVGDAVSKLCEEAGVSAEVEDGPKLARYVAAARSTALDEVCRLLNLAGQVGAFDGEGTLVGYEDDPAAEHGLGYGREIVSVESSSPTADSAARVITGEGAGGANSPNSFWPAKDFWAGGAPAPGAEARWRVAHELRTIDDARTAGTAWGARTAAAQTPVRLTCWLQPQIGPNDLLQIKGAAEDLHLGDVRVRQVIHRVGGAMPAATDIWGYDDGAGAGLLGGLLSALGGLL